MPKTGEQNIWAQELAACIERGAHERLAHYKPIFVTGTGTDVGKTYVTALLCRDLRSFLRQQFKNEQPLGFYKAAISGAESLEDSDAGYIKKKAGLSSAGTSYLFAEAVSPHLAARNQGQVIATETINNDFSAVYDSFQLTVLEGSGGIYCPLYWDLSKMSYHDAAESNDAGETGEAGETG